MNRPASLVGSAVCSSIGMTRSARIRSPARCRSLSRSDAALRRARCFTGEGRLQNPLAAADGRIVHNAGGSEVQELAYTLAVAVAYLRALEGAGFRLMPRGR